MKIVIDIEDASKYSLTPYAVYKALHSEYWEKKQKEHERHFWGMAHACDNAVRELYSHITKRPANVKNLILTYSDAENCFELFKVFADVWMREEMSRTKDDTTQAQ